MLLASSAHGRGWDGGVQVQAQAYAQASMMDTSYRRLTVRAGKSSCIKTVFQQLPVKDVPFIGITHKFEAVDYE